MKEWFIITRESGDGALIVTDDDFKLTKHNLWVNPNDKLLEISYRLRGEERTSIVLYDIPFEDIAIEEIAYEI